MALNATDAIVDTGLHTEIQVLVTEDFLCLFPVSSTRPDTPKEAIIFDRCTQTMLIERTSPFQASCTLTHNENRTISSS